MGANFASALGGLYKGLETYVANGAAGAHQGAGLTFMHLEH
jgi:hypothetical protein